MNLTRYHRAPPYFPLNHEGMHCLRLQGYEAGPSDSLWLGLSHLLPGGGTTLDASSVEKLYVVLEGEVTIATEEGEQVLRKYDSARLAPGERRALKNNTNHPASILLAMPYQSQK
ncbi:cupin domain-containing protein [Pseudoduganella sp. LjRoot289]|uniref:cupin domain-containing protein n=1 Tax=Pseudoduganella sp. LjRoot289 TaxID=3342314 RepID=UPI003ECD88C6